MCLVYELGNAHFLEKNMWCCFLRVFNLYKWHFAFEHLLFLIFVPLTMFLRSVRITVRSPGVLFLVSNCLQAV